MPGLPSTTSEIESPTGCTKQLIRVACSATPAAELMRPAGMKPSSSALRKRRSHFARSPSASTWARAFATGWRTWSTDDSSPLAYFSSSASRQISCTGRVALSALRVGVSCVFMLFFLSHIKFVSHVFDRTTDYSFSEATNCGLRGARTRSSVLIQIFQRLGRLAKRSLPLGVGRPGDLPVGVGARGTCISLQYRRARPSPRLRYRGRRCFARGHLLAG